MLIAGAEIDGRPCDVRVEAGRVTAVATDLPTEPGEEVVTAGGGALLPGLHDHHVHLHAMAAAATSVRCGPPEVGDPAMLARALQAADAQLPAGTWIRGVGYHESVAGLLDRDVLDRLVDSRPVRVQHRGGALWFVNSRGLRELGIDEPSGRLYRSDEVFRRLPGTGFPDLTDIGQQLLAMGVTSVTDATPDLARAAIDDLQQASNSGALPQSITLLGAPNDHAESARLQRGPRKLLLPDHALPPFDEIVEWIRHTHQADRAVAVHCVTRQSLLMTLAALEAADHLPGDRIEHAAVVPPEARATLAAHRIGVVTQPRFVADRGDHYLAEVDPEDRDLLYPYASLVAAGVPVAPSSDAPFGDPDPWRAMAAAAERRTPDGAVVNETERVSAAQVLAGYLSPASHPGGPPRMVAPGIPADLCLLQVPLTEALRTPTKDNVRLTLTSGKPHLP